MASKVIFAITRHEETAKRRYPWAKALVELKNGYWCFEDPEAALAYRRERTGGPVPGTGKAPDEN